jgi:hypothetical protein
LAGITGGGDRLHNLLASSAATVATLQICKWQASKGVREFVDEVRLDATVVLLRSPAEQKILASLNLPQKSSTPVSYRLAVSEPHQLADTLPQRHSLSDIEGGRTFDPFAFKTMQRHRWVCLLPPAAAATREELRRPFRHADDDIDAAVGGKLVRFGAGESAYRQEPSEAAFP